MPNLLIVIGSTRPGRAGKPIGDWFTEQAREHGGFDVEVADLAELQLPFLDEGAHPRLRQYEHEHTRAWSATVERSDAFVLVAPEYNYGYTAPVKNAIDYLHQEWLYKPIGFVTYGGIAGGTRAMQQLKQVVTALKMYPVNEAVNVPFFFNHLADGRFSPPAATADAAAQMLGELLRVEGALHTLRAGALPG